ncbi:MAG TPA: hypothetical protein VGE39_21275 [Prosthecobacter sp.]
MMNHLLQGLLAAFMLLPCGMLKAQEASVPTPIFLDQAQPDIFPKSWLTPRINAKAEPLPENQRLRTLHLLQHAISKYPAAVLKDNLHKVHLLGRLEYSGVPTGGTNSRTVVYVVNNGEARYTDHAIEGIFHAEFSSILLRNHSQHLGKDQWQQLNPLGFTYLGTGGVNAIKQQKASLKPDAVMHADGFLHQYAKADFEDDFNSMAARLMQGDAELWRLMAEYPKLQAKATLVMNFYHKLDPSFTRARFQSFCSPAQEGAKKQARP